MKATGNFRQSKNKIETTDKYSPQAFRAVDNTVRSRYLILNENACGLGLIPLQLRTNDSRVDDFYTIQRIRDNICSKS